MSKIKNKISNKVYENEMERLQIELIKLQEWIKDNGKKVVVVLKAGMQRAKAEQ